MDDVVARIHAKLSAACPEPVPRRPAFVRAPGGRRLGSPLGEQRVAAFEAVNGVRLPAAYRTFLREIGNGGIGPDCGLLPLTRWKVRDIPEGGGRLGQPFAWDPDGCVPAEWARLCAGQTDPYAGTHRVVHRGCMEMTLLVITGPARGRLLEANLGDLAAPPAFHPAPDFLRWYEDWLDGLPEGRLVPDFRGQSPGSSDELVDRLTGSDSADERLAAAYTLGGRHPLGSRAREALLAALAGDPHRGVRMEAAKTLADLYGGAAGALARALGDPDHWVRRRALVRLLEVTDDERAYGSAARALLHDENPNVRMAATDLLGRAGWA
ncbi:HEAT repeat domain-containing protein [Streptomyces sp. NBC_01013]|uniref:HEAT repeat domain-containing protein n=1 Tax=Streptomyces sp. NBC_01013 TaxID=2903718 RepID=UPI0038693224|nr:HEAT repeat domain-containing protein [Streptomyces sp. NBC_01013]